MPDNLPAHNLFVNDRCQIITNRVYSPNKTYFHLKGMLRWPDAIIGDECGSVAGV